ncbi:tetraacyldisaccharide 4'-kinase [Lawsonia intracellularis]|uniref:tetraacyldisaccharide 4'-kinase n=1 Tax=Lawsonia intracellularis TaxID=29546 RepID=UPI0009763E9E|nr:tetraacyldisaccharide 4'-kinase [Lawsonia intracellularis]OMQ04449.1 tetraacyldisaccharide 4'-kinase [Lawsonia intracellularis]
MDFIELQKNLGFILLPLSYLYTLVMRIRRAIGKIGLLGRLDPYCPCISVGNISWGGTGKTPVIDWLLDWAEQKQLSVSVLTRGYKSDNSSTILPLYVKPHHKTKEVGDEPLMLALEHPNASILVDPNRIRSGRYAVQVLKPDLLLLDDGFQQVGVKKTLDFVLLSEEDLTKQWNRVIPAGSWREGSQALEDASAFLIKADKEKMQSLLPIIQNRLFHFGKPVFSFYLKPVLLKGAGLSEAVTAKEFAGRSYILVTGVGNPNQVLHTVESYLGYSPETHIIFSDHHRYTFQDINRLLSFNLPIICTMKDFVKLQWLPVSELWGLQVKTVFEGYLWSKYSFPQWLAALWDEKHHNIVDSLGEDIEDYKGFNSSVTLFFEEQGEESIPPEYEQSIQDKAVSNDLIIFDDERSDVDEVSVIQNNSNVEVQHTDDHEEIDNMRTTVILPESPQNLYHGSHVMDEATFSNKRERDILRNDSNDNNSERAT